MRVGFIGLGRMGAGVATNIRQAGYDVAVNDKRADMAEPHLAAGCTWADSPREAAAGADVVFTSLPDPATIQKVALGEDGILAGMAPGTAWFDLSTNSPTMIRSLHPEFEKQGVAVLDAPVSGGPAGAAAGTLTVWVGGSREVFDRHTAVLESFTSRLLYVGEIGAASVAKLVHNATGYALNTVLAEVFTAGVKAGIPALELWEAVSEGGFGRMRVFEILGRQFLRQRFDPADFALGLAHKDVRLMTELAKEVGVPMRLVNGSLEEMTEALNRGWGDRDSRVAMMLQVERSGLDSADFAFSDAEVDEVRNRL